jgi:hypothetical protein
MACLMDLRSCNAGRDRHYQNTAQTGPYNPLARLPFAGGGLYRISWYNSAGTIGGFETSDVFIQMPDVMELFNKVPNGMLDRPLICGER